MTAIAILTLPMSVLAAIVGLLATGNTINVMTLGGLSLAIGPMVDSAIICLENTHRYLGEGPVDPEEAAYRGASEVALPELVSTLCTFLVLAPLALMPGMGAFLFRPMALAVAFAMIAAYILSRTFVPSRSAQWLKPAQAHDAPKRGHRRRLRVAGRRRSIAASNPTSAAWTRPGPARGLTIAVGAGSAGVVLVVTSSRSCAASSTPTSTRAPSRWPSAPRAARGSR